MNLDLSIPVIVLSFHVSRQSLTRVTDALVTSRPLLPAAAPAIG
jgi:hypothetical protein